MKQALLIFTLFCIPTFAQNAESEDQSPPSSFVATLLRGAPPIATLAVGYVGMKRYPEHRGPIAMAMIAVLGGIAYYDPYSLIAAAGPTYCVSSAWYFGFPCPCCPPGCMFIMQC